MPFLFFQGRGLSLAVETQHIASQSAETQYVASLQCDVRQGFGPQSKNLSSIVRGIKIGTTAYARRNNLPFAWQARFHDRIIRDQEEMNRIAEYIENNVARWEYDGMNRGAMRRKYASILSGKNKYILYLSQAMGKEVQCPLSVSIKE